MPYSDAQKAFIGRWDLTAQTPGDPQPAWLEVHISGPAAVVGQFVGWHGSARPISRIDLTDTGLSFTIPKQFERGDGGLTLEGKLEGDQLVGTIAVPDGSTVTFTGNRAPSLRSKGEPTWGETITLFNGTDITGWKVIQGASQWEVADGILRNNKPGGNIVTEQAFNDFKLHLEFRLPPNGNSGVYLRGRYEVQVLDNPAEEPDSHLQGGVYGFLTPSEIVTSGVGEWTVYDITLVGRQVTVEINGTTVISKQAIPGITGGALDSDEGAPGPLMLQGDHTAIEYRNITITPAAT